MTRVLSMTVRKQTSLEDTAVGCAQSDGLLNMFRYNFMAADYTLNFLGVKIFFIFSVNFHCKKAHYFFPVEK